MNRPQPDFTQLAKLADVIVSAMSSRGVHRVEHVVAFSEPFDYSLWLGTSTDAERDDLQRDDSVAALLKELTDSKGPRGASFRGFTIESQETVDRDFRGSWFYRLR